MSDIEQLLAAVEARGPALLEAGQALIATAAAFRTGMIGVEEFVARVAAIHRTLQLAEVPAGEC